MFRNKKIIFAVPFFALLGILPVHANWEYNERDSGTGIYSDDGSRFTISLRGGFSSASGKIKNELGSLVPPAYYVEDATGIIVSGAYCGGTCGAGYTSVGQIDVADLPAAKKLSSYSFASAISVGWTLPNAPQWRMEGNWDHISESEYNSSPMFDGVTDSTTGDNLHVLSSGVNSTMTTDIISAMFYYDFFDGMVKPKNQFIPYIGLGLGYADTKTVLNLTDLYGDLSSQVAMQEFGEDTTSTGVLEFYRSETNSSNIAGVLAAGFSYGLDDGMFLDFGVRVTYLPKIKWALNNEENSAATSFKSKDIFSANSVIYTNVLLGIRFEF